MRYVSTLPELLRAVPDKLGAMDERLGQQVERQDRIDDVLARLTGLLTEQQRTTQTLAGAIDALAEQTRGGFEGIAQLRQSVAALDDRAEGTGQAIKSIEESLRARETQSDAAVQKQNRQIARLLAMVVVFLVVVLIAVVGGVAFAWWRMTA